MALDPGGDGNSQVAGNDGRRRERDFRVAADADEFNGCQRAALALFDRVLADRNRRDSRQHRRAMGLGCFGLIALRLVFILFLDELV